MCTANSKIIHMANAHVRQESFLDDSNCRKYEFLGFHPGYTPRSVKQVEVRCSNKTYQGIGIRNNAGGLEFYSNDYNTQRTNLLAKELAEVQNHKKALVKEQSLLQNEIAFSEPELDIWNERLHSLIHSIKEHEESIRSLVVLSQNGNITNLQKEQQRKVLMRLISNNKKDVRLIRQHQAILDSKKKRLRMLQLILPQLDCLIKDLQHNKSILSTVTVGETDLLFFPNNCEAKSSSCCLFADIFDYISYVYLQRKFKGKKLPVGCDCIVMNDPRNFINMMITSDDYDKIFVLFPNTIFGCTIEQTILQRNPTRTVSVSSLYSDYVSLQRYAENINLNNN